MHTANPSMIYVTSSSVYVDGNYEASANDGIFFSADRGVTPFEKISGSMTWEFGMPVAINTKNEPWVFVGSQGTGFQKALLPSVKIQTKIFLEGAYNSNNNEMLTNINSNIPNESPYSENPRSVGSIHQDVVDWVLVELRKAPNGNAIVSKSVLLNKDGRIVADNGTYGEVELAAPNGAYYLVIKHRNHLAIMSKDPIQLNNTSSTLYDFTN